jgi:hypothetical protein
MSSDDQIEQVDEAADELEQAGEDVGQRTVWFARGYLVLLFAGIALAGGAAVVGGYVEVGTFVVGGEVEAGAAITWLIRGFVFLFLVFTGAAVLISLPFSFWSRILSTGARLADAYELPEEARARTGGGDDQNDRGGGS